MVFDYDNDLDVDAGDGSLHLDAQGVHLGNPVGNPVYNDSPGVETCP
jgi:hypothetical protein